MSRNNRSRILDLKLKVLENVDPRPVSFDKNFDSWLKLSEAQNCDDFILYKRERMTSGRCALHYISRLSTVKIVDLTLT